VDTLLTGLAGTLGGAIGGLLGFLLAQLQTHWRRPQLKIDFESYAGSKPYIHELRVFYPDEDEISGFPYEDYGLFLRLSISNRGQSPAINCEARVSVFKVSNGKKEREPWSSTLHWSVRDPLIYKEPEQQYAPIHLNPKSPAEALDVLHLDYVDVMQAEEHSVKSHPLVYTCAMRPHALSPEQVYEIEVTVSANNTVAKPFRFRTRWDGTIEQFRNGKFIVPPC